MLSESCDQICGTLGDCLIAKSDAVNECDVAVNVCHVAVNLAVNLAVNVAVTAAVNVAVNKPDPCTKFVCLCNVM